MNVFSRIVQQQKRFSGAEARCGADESIAHSTDLLQHVVPGLFNTLSVDDFRELYYPILGILILQWGNPNQTVECDIDFTLDMVPTMMVISTLSKCLNFSGE